MTRRGRFRAYGSAVAFIVAGGIAGLIIGGYTGELVAVTALTLGLGAVVLLVFLEIGLSEDRDRAKEEAQRHDEAAAQRSGPQHRPTRQPRPRRPA